jgi:hypothetical protein
MQALYEFGNEAALVNHAVAEVMTWDHSAGGASYVCTTTVDHLQQ